ncbi:MAG: hypothetical protein ACE361_22570 [Aureliella sp.]
MPRFDAISIKALPSELVAFVTPLPLPTLGEESVLDAAEQLPALVSALKLDGSLAESALWLLVGDLHRSHDISQTDGSAEGSFWHGIMHRREGDFGNSKYWFRRVGKHSVHTELANHIVRNQSELDSTLPLQSLGQANQLADVLVDLSSQAMNGNPESAQSLRKITWWEWQLLYSASTA